MDLDMEKDSNFGVMVLFMKVIGKPTLQMERED